MFLSELPRVLLRRWYLVVVGVLFTAGLAMVTIQLVPAEYESTSEVLLLPPATSVQEGGNPYLALGGLENFGEILARSMSDERAVESLKAAGAQNDFSIEKDGTTSAPLVLITVQNTSPQATGKTMDLIVERVPAALLDLQRSVHVTSDAFIRSSVLTKDDKPQVVRKPQIRAVLVAVVGGLAATLLTTAGLDALVNSRRRRRQEKRSAAQAAGSSDGPRARRRGKPGNPPKPPAESGQSAQQSTRGDPGPVEVPAAVQVDEPALPALHLGVSRVTRSRRDEAPPEAERSLARLSR